MDTTHQKFTNTTNYWEQYNMSVDNHILDHHHNQISPFDHTQWSNYPLVHQNPNEPSNSSPTQLLSSLGSTEQAGTFKVGDNQEEVEDQEEELGAMKEMMFKIAAMQPIDIDPATVRKPKRRNVRISDDPQSVAARHRRERISEKMRILQRLVPGGTKMDTASMLDEAVRYVKFLKRQILTLQANPYPPPSAPGEEWVGIGGTSYMFGGNGINDAANHDDSVCFNM